VPGFDAEIGSAGSAFRGRRKSRRCTSTASRAVTGGVHEKAALVFVDYPEGKPRAAPPAPPRACPRDRGESRAQDCGAESRANGEMRLSSVGMRAACLPGRTVTYSAHGLGRHGGQARRVDRGRAGWSTRQWRELPIRRAQARGERPFLPRPATPSVRAIGQSQADDSAAKVCPRRRPRCGFLLPTPWV